MFAIAVFSGLTLEMVSAPELIVSANALAAVSGVRRNPELQS